jgi:ketol-acid reductoisomerase
MKRILAEIQSGQFAKEWIGENKAGRQKFLAMRDENKKQTIEEVGRELRSMMTFLRKKRETGVPVE